MKEKIFVNLTFVNLTPHDINIYDSNNNLVATIPRSGKVARVTMEQKTVGYIDVNGHKIPVKKTIYGEIENLPDPQPNTIYIVSLLVLQALGGTRDDVLAPDTGAGAVRDDQGRIIGTRNFIKL
ncbi:MAG TPA: hypothetical protein ENF45_04315 [Bacteroidetes bacterium]|nr:hypothetical protein [Bacteroidota bacterium]